MNHKLNKINNSVKGMTIGTVRNTKSLLPLQMQYILAVFLLGLFFMFLFRIGNYAIHLFSSFSDLNPLLLLESLLIGLRFDTIVSMWFLMPFLLLLIIGSIFSIKSGWYYRTIHLLLVLVYVLVFSIFAADVAFYTYFGTHISAVALSWIGKLSYIVSIIGKHPIILLYIAAFFVFIGWYLWLMYCLYNATLFKVIPPFRSYQSMTKRIISSIVLVLLCALGMYGRITDSKPLSIQSAYFCDSDFFNQLGVNPVFNVYKSVVESSDHNSSVLGVVDALTLKQTLDKEFLLRNDITYSMEDLPQGTNVVIVLMEDVSQNDTRNMPFVNSIKQKSLYFSNVASDSRSFANCLFSVLFSYPSVLGEQSMDRITVPRLESLQGTLAQRGYHTIFFTPHKQKDDNITRFLYANSMKEVVSNISTDNDYYLDKIDGLSQPFFATILLYANDTRHSAKNMDKQVSKVFSSLKNLSSFDNTLIILTSNSNNGKVPLIFYMPKQIKVRENNNLAMLIDVFPTVCRMIDEGYRNSNTLGINIFSAKRSYAFSSDSHSITVFNDSVKYVWRDNGYESLYLTNRNDKIPTNYIKLYPNKALEMKQYVFSMLQKTQEKLVDVFADDGAYNLSE